MDMNSSSWMDYGLDNVRIRSMCVAGSTYDTTIDHFLIFCIGY